MVDKIFPSKNAVGGGSLEGRKITEQMMENLIKAMTPFKNHVVSGGAPTDGGGFVCDIAAGTGMINGHYVEWDATNITLPASSVGRIYLTLQRTAGLVTGIAPEQVANSGAIPADSLLLSVWATSSTDILLIADERIFSQGIVTGEYQGDGTSTQDIVISHLSPNAGTPTLVIATGEEDTNKIFGVSGISLPTQRDFGSAGVPNNNFPAFSVRDRSSSTQFANVAEVLVGSKQWDPPLLVGPATTTTTTVTVVGAEVGDFVAVYHSGYSVLDGHGLLAGRVTSTDTVTVTLRSEDTGYDLGDFILRVVVIKDAVRTIPKPDCHFVREVSGQHAPYILQDGFRVGHDLSGQPDLPTLNENGKRYHYLCFM